MTQELTEAVRDVQNVELPKITFSTAFCTPFTLGKS
jgi:hypothetical protein